MSQLDIKKIKKDLLAEKKRLEKEINKIACLSPGGQTKYQINYVELGDQKDENAAEATLLGKNISLESDLGGILKTVNKALEKIKKGNYGICEECQKEINPKRISVFPSATLCIKCKKKQNQLG